MYPTQGPNSDAPYVPPLPYNPAFQDQPPQQHQYGGENPYPPGPQMQSPYPSVGSYPPASYPQYGESLGPSYPSTAPVHPGPPSASQYDNNYGHQGGSKTAMATGLLSGMMGSHGSHHGSSGSSGTSSKLIGMGMQHLSKSSHTGPPHGQQYPQGNYPPPGNAPPPGHSGGKSDMMMGLASKAMSSGGSHGKTGKVGMAMGLASAMNSHKSGYNPSQGNFGSMPVNEMSQDELRAAKRAAQYGMPVGSVTCAGLQPGEMGCYSRGLKPFLTRLGRPTSSRRKSA